MQDKYIKTVGGYRLTDRMLGKGAFSQVFLAFSPYATNYQQEKVAVKVIQRTKITQQQTKRFQRQVQILKSCKNENIVDLIDFKKTQKNFYIFLEYCEDGNLDQYIKTKQKLSQPQALKFFSQILKGMTVMHHAKIVHRDIKSANILLHKGRAKIADFGLACKFSKDNKMMQSFAGSPLNMAPEILKGQLYTNKVDVYSAGTLLYQMLFGAPPFIGKTCEQILNKIQTDKLKLNENQVSKQVGQLLKEMLHPIPQKRIDLPKVLDFIQIYEQKKRNEKLQQYKRLSLQYLKNIGLMGGLCHNLNLNIKQCGGIQDMDLRLCARLNNSLQKNKQVCV